MGKLIFLDIDGTLTQMLAPPTPRVIRAIREARANGHQVFLCTGRNPPIITEDILDIGFDGVVASAGCHVEVNGQVLYDSVLPEETVQELTAMAARRKWLPIHRFRKRMDGASVSRQ